MEELLTEVKESEDSSTLDAEESSTSELETSEEVKKEQQTIPYFRFKEVNDRKKEAEERAKIAEEKAKIFEEQLKYLHSLAASSDEAEEAPRKEFNWNDPDSEIRKIVEETITTRVPEFTRYELQKRQSADEALKIFPELADYNSEFFKATANYWVTSGLESHLDGIKIAASYIATTKMPEILRKRLTTGEEIRKTNLGFVEGGQIGGGKAEEYILSPEQEKMLTNLGLTKEMKKQVIQNLLASQGGER
jgi:hypothetical protein